MELFFHGRMLNLVTMIIVLASEIVWNVGVCNGDGRTALVTGMVFCDQCSLGSLSALSHPLAGAEVSLQCKQGLATASFVASTDENGVFSISVEEEQYGFEIHGVRRRCTVQLGRSNDKHCQVPTDIEGGVSGATISIDWGGYTERVMYYVGPLAYRVRLNHPSEACNGLKLKSRQGIRLQSSLLPVGSTSLRASSSRGLKTVDTMPTIPSTAATMPSTAFSRTNPPSDNLPVTRPTPVDDSPRPVKPPGSNPSPTKCLPLPPIPHYSELTKLGLHYPLCKTRPPSSPHIPSPIRSVAPKDKSPFYGGSPMGKHQPPPPPKGFKPAHPSPPPTLSPTPERHPIHRPNHYHRPSSLPPQRTPSLSTTTTTTS